jgi:maleylacetate reductase
VQSPFRQEDITVTPAEARAAAAAPEARTPVTIWGAGSVGELAEICTKAGMTRVMAVAGRSADGVAGQIPALLGRRYLGRWSDVPPHVPAHQANLAVGSAQETHADGVVAIGGGAAIGLAKIVALALRLPLIAVPTTYSGSEMTSRYLVTTERGAETGASPRALPTAVIYDPDLLAPMARRIAVTGVTAVAHCLEALCYPDVCDDARDQAREGLLLLWDSLVKVAAGTADLSCRQDALAGASLAGRAYEAAGPGLLHLLCDLTAAARHDVSYAILPALLLPPVLRAHGARAEPARAAIGDLRPGVTAETALREFAAALGVTGTIDGLSLRAALTAHTEKAGSHPGLRPGRVTSAEAGRLREILAAPGQ